MFPTGIKISDAFSFGISGLITEEAKDYILEKGWDEQYGARPLKRAIQKYVEDNLANEIILNNLVVGDVIKVDYNSEVDDIQIIIESPSLIQYPELIEVD